MLMDVYNNTKLLGKQGKYNTRSIKNSVTVFTNSFLCREIRRHFASVRDKSQNILSVEVTCGHDLLHGLFNNNSVTTV